MNPLTLINPLTKVAGEILERVWPSPEDKQNLEHAKTQMVLALQQQALSEDSDFRHFMLAYEGAAKDLPKSMQILRSSVRPILTYLLVGTTLWLVWQGSPIPTTLRQLDLLACGFWFGEKAVKNVLRVKNGAKLQSMPQKE